jgi:hypothetical protein
MKLQAILWLLGPIGAFAIGTPFYLKQQVLSPPTWTTTQAISDPQSRQAARTSALAKLQAAETRLAAQSAAPADSREPATLSLTAPELSALAADEVDRLSQTYGVPGVARSVSAQIADGKLEGGVTVNLAALPRESLSSKERSILDAALKALPELGQRDVYIGLSGQPIVQDSQVQWDPNLKVQIGGLTLGVDQLANQLGLKEADLRQDLNQVLAQLKVSALAIEGDQLHIQAQP